MTKLALACVIAWAAVSCGGRTSADPVPPPASPAPVAPAPPPAAAATPAAAAAAPAEPTPKKPQMLDIAVPKLTARVMDQAKVFTPAEARALEKKLKAHEKKTGNQFAVLTWTDLGEHAIEDFSYTVANTWALGRREHDDGLLIVVAPTARKARIEVGEGLEQAIPDALAQRVMDEQLVPACRKGEYAAGVEAAFDQLMAAAAKK